MAKIVTQFFPRFYEAAVGKIALLTMDNGEDYKKPTTFDEEALNSLNKALDLIQREQGVKGPTGSASTAAINWSPFM